MNICPGQPLLLEQRQRETDSKQSVNDQMESNLLLRLQVEDLQKRLEEKKNKLNQAQETIKALRCEVQSLQEQLAFEKSKHQEPKATIQGSKIQATVLSCKDQPSICLRCRNESSPTHPFCSDITEELPVGQDDVSLNQPVMSENWPLPWQARTSHMQTRAIVNQSTISPSCVSEPGLTRLSGLIRNRGRSPEQLLVKTLVVSLEDCQHKLGPDGVLRLPERKEQQKEEQAREDADRFEERRNCNHESKTALSGMEDSRPSKSQTQEEGHYVCRQCSRAFSQPILLSLHLKMHNISGMKYSNDSGWPSHNKGRTSEPSHSCDVCSKTFSQSNHLKLHQRAHRRSTISQQLIKDGQKTFQRVFHACDECSRTFSRINYLRFHQRRHRKQIAAAVNIKNTEDFNRAMSYACDQCTKTFSQINYLRLHQRMHRRPVESLIHIEDGRKSMWKMTHHCNQCDKTFSQLNYLKLHQRMHGRISSPQIPLSDKVQAWEKRKASNSAPPQCGTCGKVFSNRAYLKVHQRVHTKEKPYACVVCNKTFAMSSNLYTHQRAMHKGKVGTCSKCGGSVSYKRLSQESPLVCSSCSVSQKNAGQTPGAPLAEH